SVMNTDDRIRQMQEDEVADAPLITPVAYGKLRGIAPQLVYYHIKAKHLEAVHCDCGRKCIRREDADAYFRKIGKLAPIGHSGADAEDGEGAPGRTREDEDDV